MNYRNRIIENGEGANPMIANAPPLSAVINTTRSGVLDNLKTARRYVGNMTSTAFIQNQGEASNKPVVFEIKRRAMEFIECMPDSEKHDAYSHSVRLSDTMIREILSFTAKSTNVTGAFSTMDFAGIIYVLSAGVAHYVSSGTLTCNDLRRGNALALRAVNTRDDPVSTISNGVFIPRRISDNATPGMFAALCAAVNGFGVTVFTDIVAVTDTGAPEVMENSNGELAMACVSAIRQLLALYDHVGCGGIAAVAVIRGMHAVNSVVSHSDEGGYIREVLRKNSYCAPYGGMVPLPEVTNGYMGLPMPTHTSAATFCSLVDSILLSSAGLSALSDPLMQIGNKYVPSVYTSSSGLMNEPGTNNEGTGYDASNIARQIAADCGGWCDNYTALASKLFCVDNSQDKITSAVLAASFAGMLSMPASRHLKYKVVAPYFWIEPTTLFKDDFGSLAEQHGFGPICYTGMSVNMPFFERMTTIHDTALHAYVSIPWTSLRTSGLMLHLTMNAKNGLSCFVPQQFEKNKTLLTGGTDTINEMREHGAAVSDYAWNRGQSFIPAPAEFLYIGNEIGFKINHTTFNDEGTMHSEHVPNKYEMDGQDNVHFECRAPVRIGDNIPNISTREVRRCRTQGTEALDAVRNRVKRGMMTGGEIWVVGDNEPSYRAAGDTSVRAGTSYIERVEMNDSSTEKVKRGPGVKVIRHSGPVTFTPPKRNIVNDTNAAPGGTTRADNMNIIAETGKEHDSNIVVADADARQQTTGGTGEPCPPSS